MENYKHVLIQAHPSGLVRIYANGGCIYEVHGDYVRVDTMIDPQKTNPSGEMPPKREKS